MASFECMHTTLTNDTNFQSHQFEGRMEGPHQGGGFADIYCTRLKSIQPPRRIAVKCFRPVPSIDDLPGVIANELKIWKILNNNANIVKFLGVITSYEYPGFNQRYMSPWAVCEYHENKDLDTFLLNRNLDAFERLQLLIGAIRGLRHIHDQSVIHGDLKANNVLVSDQNIAKICDFGSASISCGCYDGPEDQDGTLQWESPELLDEEPRSTSSDIWAFGCVALEVQFGRIPYDPDRKKASSMMINGLLPAMEYQCPQDEIQIAAPVWGIMQKCWRLDPAARPDAMEVLSDFEAVVPI